MFIKRLKPNVYDVFIGLGWNLWARVIRASGDVRQIGGGVRLDQRTLQKVREKVTQ